VTARRLRPLAAVFATTLALSATWAVAAPGGARAAAAAAPVCRSSSRPRFAAWLSRGIQRALAGRVSRVGLTVADPRLGLSCALHRTSHFDSASAIKATIISALLYKEHGPSHLTSAQRGLAWRMITQSDNAAASALWDEVGDEEMQRFADAAHMSHTGLDDAAWGLSQLTAQDELTLLTLLTTHGSVLSDTSRGYVLWLMSRVIPSQRWGVPDGAPAHVTVSVKNGWLPDPESGRWHVNSIGAFRSLGAYRSRHVDYQIAVLTDGNPSESYGIATIQAVARVINHDIAHA
jgi:Beta-lactamase enzyme family